MPAGKAPPMTANWYAPVPPEATTEELYATPNWMVVPGAHKTDSGGSVGFGWLGGCPAIGFGGSCGNAAVEMTANIADRMAVFMNMPLRHPPPSTAACSSR